MAMRIRCRCGTLLEAVAVQPETVPTCPGCGRHIHTRSGHSSFRAVAEENSASDQNIHPGSTSTTSEENSGELDLRLIEPPAAATADDEAPAAISYAAHPAIEAAHLHPHTMGEVIEGPKRSFQADIGVSFAYPFMSIGNTVNFSIIVFITAIGVAALFVLSLGGMAVCVVAPLIPLGVIGALYCTGWLCAFLLAVVQDSASGSDDLPDIKIEDFSVRAILRSALRYCGAHVVVLGPAAILSLASLFASPNASFYSSSLPPLFALVIGSLLLPTALLLFAVGPARQIFRLGVIFASIWRTLLPYLATWLIVTGLQILQVFLILTAFIKCFEPELSGGLLAFLVVVLVLTHGLSGTFCFLLLLVRFIGIIEVLNLVRPLVAWIPHLGPLGILAIISLNLYLAIVSMRTVGIYYRHFKKRFAIVLE